MSQHGRITATLQSQQQLPNTATVTTATDVVTIGTTVIITATLQSQQQLPNNATVTTATDVVTTRHHSHNHSHIAVTTAAS